MRQRTQVMSASGQRRAATQGGARVAATVAVVVSMVLTGTLPVHAGYDPARGAAQGSFDRNRDSAALGSTVTVTGRLTSDADDNNFDMVDAAGRSYHVETSRFVAAEAANKLVSGDVVRVHGEWDDNMIKATNVRFLGKRFVPIGTRVYVAPYYYVVGSSRTVTGTLITDADDDEFEIRATNGRVYMIRTRLIPDAYGLNKLVKGNAVRVHGSWLMTDNGEPVLEASNVAVLR